jgi:hypothetical protein
LVAHAGVLLVPNSTRHGDFGLLVRNVHNTPMIGSTQADWQK